MNRFCPYCGNITIPLICLRCGKHFGGICHECPDKNMTLVFDENGDLMHVCSDILKELMEEMESEDREFDEIFRKATS